MKLIGPTLLIAAGVLLFYKGAMGGPIIAVLSGSLIIFGLLRFARGLAG